MFESLLQKARLTFIPELPPSLTHPESIDFQSKEIPPLLPEIEPLFFHLKSQPKLVLLQKSDITNTPQKVGVILSGGQAPGGHNVIAAIFDTLKSLHPESVLIGFLDGPSGLVRNKYKEITKELLFSYRNQGGFDMIGSGRTKIETKEQFAEAKETALKHQLTGIIIIGGDDSNTNAALLAEYFLKVGCSTCVVGVPKTIDGDLKTENIELSFGFDTACKVYSESIGNIARDALSAKKYYYFMKLMGRSASHITLECALKTHPNLALISEEVQKKKWTLKEVSSQIIDLVRERYQQQKQYGVILIPEGIIEFMPDMQELVVQLNSLLSKKNLDEFKEEEEKVAFVTSLLPEHLKNTFSLLSKQIQLQLLFDRDPHGNVQVSKIDTERLFMHLASQELQKQQIPHSFQPIFCGYEGRSALPSVFDCTYCSSLGVLAALLIARGKTGYIASFKNLAKPVQEWQAVATPLASMLRIEERDGKQKAVIEKALVDMAGKPFGLFASQRALWRLEDSYEQPGPIQFFGPKELTDSVPLSLL
jgi:pyrophosphate--fructose-6-phosphate 1-phosphotransferase